MSILLDLLLAGSRIATVVGVALIAGAVAALVWLWTSARRPGQEMSVEGGEARGRVRVPQGYWHPSMGPDRRPEPVTELLPRCADDPDATVLVRIPRQREASR
ncbi:hypothetical protein JNW88_00155 [Micromonospora sp. ATA32]|nr:hypothetical protein [Micromonospora sp. ATA32]